MDDYSPLRLLTPLLLAVQCCTVLIILTTQKILLSLLLLANVSSSHSLNPVQKRVGRHNVMTGTQKVYHNGQGGSDSQYLHKPKVDLASLYPEYNISVPIDHFHNDTSYDPHSGGTFHLRYWFDVSYYRDRGPVIVLQSGETGGTGRLPFLQKGLLHQLAQATNGIGVVLEHRYYDTSFPTPDLATKNLRFPTTDQALADMAYFAQHVIFEGLEDKNLTAPATAYFGYGGSYAGAFVAFLRLVYPNVYYGRPSMTVVVYRTKIDH